MGVYSRLLSLYRKTRNTDKTPLEDFITELLVGTLEKEQEILDEFVQEVLQIQGSHFSIDSQKKYELIGDINCIVDIVIENENNICFIENKVNAGEGVRQLERYKRVLIEKQLNQSKSIYLRYCTKYYDLKDVANIDFLQYRWSDVYKFLEKHNRIPDVENLLIFLRSEGMATAGNFNFQDLFVMRNINSTIAKMDECLDKVKPIISNLFGKPYEYDFERLKQICKFERYVMWCNKVLGIGDSEVLIGFEFTDENNGAFPMLVAKLYLATNNSELNNAKNEIEKLNIFDGKDYDSYGYIFWFEKPLSDFLSSQNQIDDICKWFIEKLQLIYELEKVTAIKWN